MRAAEGEEKVEQSLSKARKKTSGCEAFQRGEE